MGFTLILFLFLTIIVEPSISALVKQPPVLLNYHNGAILKGNITVNFLWYGHFTPSQRSIIVDFIHSLSSSTPPPPSAASWWRTTSKYTSGGASSSLLVGNQILDQNYSFGKSLKNAQLATLASKLGRVNSVNFVLTAADVAVDGFCMRCGTHGSTPGRKNRFVYAWVGNSETQCPGQCAWPFHQPVYGPQTRPLVAPNGDVGIDGVIINLATVLAGAVTNPFNNGYFQGSAAAPLEAVSACTGVFGSGAYPGYAGRVLVDQTTGASYNAHGLNGRKYLLPAMWDPQTSICSTLV